MAKDGSGGQVLSCIPSKESISRLKALTESHI